MHVRICSKGYGLIPRHLSRYFILAPLNKQAEAFLVNAIDQTQDFLESKAINLLKSSQRLLWKGFVDQARAVARQAGFLAKFEKQFQANKRQLFAYQEAGIRGPLKGVANFLKGIAHLGCEPITATKEIGKGIGAILEKIGEFEAAADYLDSNPDKALEIYDRLNKEFDETVGAYLRNATGPELFEKCLEIATEWYLTGVAIHKGTQALRFAANKFVKALEQGTPVNEAITSISNEIGAPLDPQFREFLDAIEKYPQEFKTATSGGTRTEQAVATGVEGARVEQAIVNQTSTAILKNGYYEVNGFKFSEYYYNKLWNTGRKAPSLIAKEILENATTIVPDTIKPGFFYYKFGEWEMIYNPTTKEVWHLKPIK